MTNKEKLIEELEDKIHGIELMIYDYEYEIEEIQQDIYLLDSQKDSLEIELAILLESVEE
ncbi:TPA: hypothetical protein SVB51_001402 [Streptococcus equi subsp. equi]|uniref:hypothetical protein n=1 Tax=Streptococcus equi TaxID=1336 RepID=UPI000658F1BE|nr:hypothetical protein [Streptococcus equi]CRQ91008.1 Uncharacterised protein [Streptococcus equi subsp. equi]CRU20448.1 Uncharacterised protein [Streptococcus equi subsp. equi]CRU52923.1 Uncharacterised protein [Streptococcus equi subsp. equi]CRU69174.1 Uncharacterised protein [Streptococcus equi subsp. equi]CRW38607.1 Uncharacterised protein [Streptococcus equi subsp. equi]